LVGERWTTHHGARARAPNPIPVLDISYLLVDPGEPLRARIASRVAALLADGWEEEVSRLRARWPPDAPAFSSCGYAWLSAAQSGACSRAHAIERTIIETRQYAKRQRTWFRHQLPAARVTHVDPTAPDALQRAVAWWNGRKTAASLTLSS
jgi:tRNA dimethylallyltransferase